MELKKNGGINLVLSLGFLMLIFTKPEITMAAHHPHLPFSNILLNGVENFKPKPFNFANCHPCIDDWTLCCGSCICRTVVGILVCDKDICDWLLNSFVQDLYQWIKLSNHESFYCFSALSMVSYHLVFYILFKFMNCLWFTPSYKKLIWICYTTNCYGYICKNYEFRGLFGGLVIQLHPNFQPTSVWAQFLTEAVSEKFWLA